jgi:3-oxoadipate enol-lactonase
MTTPALPATKVAKIGRYEINYADEGTGFPVLLIHGLAGDHTAWVPQINAWKGRYRLIAPDTRGAGRSSQVDEPVTISGLADDFVALLDQLGIEKCHIIGRSMGGALGQEVTLKAPQKVQSLTMLASLAKADRMCIRVLDCLREVLEWRQSWEDHARHGSHYFVSARFFNENPDKMAAIEKLVGGTDRKIACYSHSSKAVKEHDLLDRLHQIKCAVMVMSGEADLICSRQCQQWMVDRMPQAEWIEFKDAAHFFMMEQPEKFMAAMTGFLDKHTPAR